MSPSDSAPGTDAAPPPSSGVVGEDPPPVPAGPPRIWPPVVTLVSAFFGTLLLGCFGGAVFLVPVVRSLADAGTGGGGGAAATPAVDTATLFAAVPGFLIASMAVTQLSLLAAVRKMPGFLDDVGPGGWLARVRWREDSLSLPSVVLTAAGTWAAGGLVLFGLALAGSKEGGMLTALHDASRRAEPSTFAWVLLFGAIGAGLAEELAFRGLLQSRLVERWGPVRGIAVTALVFGLWHFDFRQGLAAVVMGAWLGFVAWRQGTVVNVVFGHMLNNAVALSLVHVSERSEGGAPPALLAVAELLVLAACAVGVTWLARRTERRAAEPACP